MPKVSSKTSASVLNTMEVKIENESHTAASVIVERINESPHCEYASYKIAHPTDSFVLIKIKSDDNKNVRTLFKDSLMSIVDDIEDLSAQVRQAHV